MYEFCLPYVDASTPLLSAQLDHEKSVVYIDDVKKGTGGRPWAQSLDVWELSGKVAGAHKVSLYAWEDGADGVYPPYNVEGSVLMTEGYDVDGFDIGTCSGVVTKKLPCPAGRYRASPAAKGTPCTPCPRGPHCVSPK